MPYDSYFKPNKSYIAVLIRLNRPMRFNVDTLYSTIVREFKSFPLLIAEPKYDGADVEVIKRRDRIRIYTEDGSLVTGRLPTIVEALRKVKKDFTCLGELEKYVEGRHRPREEVSGYLHSRGRIDDKDFIITLYDILYLNGKDVSKEFALRRVKLLYGLGVGQSALTPKPPLNVVPYLLCKTRASLQKAAATYCPLKHFEGMVLKVANFGYWDKPYLIKFKKFMAVLAIVVRVYVNRGGSYNYDVALIPHPNADPREIRRIKDRKYQFFAKTYNTSIKCKVGDVVELRLFSAKLKKTEAGIVFHAYGPQVAERKGMWKRPNTVREVIDACRYYGILHTD